MNYKHLRLGLCFMMMVSSCSTPQDYHELPSFTVTCAVQKDTVIYNEYVADIQAVRNIDVRSRVTGFIDQVCVDEGQYVSEGQLLFTLRREDFEQELIKAISTVKSARAEYKAAEIALKASIELYEKGIVAKPEFELAEVKSEAAKGDLDEAIANEEQARLNLKFTQIRAPFTGQINRIPHKVGSLIEEGMLLTNLNNVDEVFAYYNVSEAEYLEYELSKRRGEKNQVLLVMANGATYDLPGYTETSESVIDKSTGNIAFRARFKNPTRLLKHGATAKVLVRNEVQNMLFVPHKATFDIQGKVYIMLIQTDRTLKIKEIKPLYRLDNLFLLQDGLSLLDTLLYEGVQLVQEGDRIQPVFARLDSLIKP